MSAHDTPPLYFDLPVWGKEYVRVFLETCLPAQLSPGNIPVLAGDDRHQYHIFTTRDDYVAIVASPAFQRLQTLINTQVHLIEGPKRDSNDRSNWGERYDIKGECDRTALGLAAEVDAANIMLNADIVLCDGFVRRTLEILASGKRVIEMPGPRTLKASMEKALQTEYRAADGVAITVSPRQLTTLGIRYLHPLLDMHKCEGYANENRFHPSHLYWPVGKNSIVARCFHMQPWVIRPRYPKGGFSTTIDDDLVENTCPDLEDSYVVTDSDDMFCCELSGPDHHVGSMAKRGDLGSILDFYTNYGRDRNYLLLDFVLYLRGSEEPQRLWDQGIKKSERLVGSIQAERNKRAAARERERAEAPPVPPIHFIVPVWGTKSVETFLNTTLPAQLALGNLPVLAGDKRHKYHIYTTDEFYWVILNSPAFKKLETVIDGSIHKTGHTPTSDSIKYDDVVAGVYRSASRRAAEVMAANVLLNPDVVLADGFIKRVCEILASGKRLIEVPKPWALQDSMQAALNSCRDATDGVTIAISPRQLTALTLANSHPAMGKECWEHPDLSLPCDPTQLYWKAGPAAYVARCYRLFPIVVRPNTRGVQFRVAPEADLAQYSCPKLDESYIVTDSDDLFCCELAPEDVWHATVVAQADVARVADYFVRNAGRRNNELLDVVLHLKGEDVPASQWAEAEAAASSFLEKVASERQVQEEKRVQATRQRLLGAAASQPQAPRLPVPAPRVPLPAGRRRSIRFLLAVWGDHHSDLFRNFALPSLLAPGNIPTLVRDFDCVFEVITESQDFETWKIQPIIQKLEMYCPVVYTALDDITVKHSYGVMLTMAFARGIAARKEEMTNTSFIFLNADFLFSDGSLTRLASYINEGYSGVLAPSFRCVAEDFTEAVRPMIDPEHPVLSLNGRQLSRIALDLIHPTFKAKIVNQGADPVQTEMVNQFLWKVDDDTMLGRFYLLFMLCITPEQLLEEVVGFCDYTFIPEMCPSGNIKIATDSDDIFILELQHRAHEAEFFFKGRPNTSYIASRIAEWSTPLHRRYSEENMLFHVADLPPALDSYQRQAADFMASINEELGPPQPYREHCYWTGTLASLQLSAKDFAVFPAGWPPPGRKRAKNLQIPLAKPEPAGGPAASMTADFEPADTDEETPDLAPPLLPDPAGPPKRTLAHRARGYLRGRRTPGSGVKRSVFKWLASRFYLAGFDSIKAIVLAPPRLLGLNVVRKRDLASLHGAYDEAVRTALQVTESNRVLHGTISRLRSACKEALDHLTRITAEKAAAVDDLARIQTQRDSVQDDLEAATAELTKTRNEAVKAGQDLAVVRLRHRELEGRYESARIALEAAQGYITALTAERDRYESASHGTGAELDRQRALVGELSAEVKLKALALETLTAELDAAQEACRITGEKLLFERRAVEELSARFTLERQAHEATRYRLAGEQQALEATRDRLAAEQEAHEATGDRLAGEQEAHEATSAELNDERDAHEATCNRLAEERRAHQATAAQLTDERHAHEATGGRLAEERRGRETALAQFDGEQRAHRASLTELGAERQARQSVIAELQVERCARQTALAELQAERNIHMGTRAELEAERGAHHTVITLLAGERSSQQSAAAALAAARVAHQATAAELQAERGAHQVTEAKLDAERAARGEAASELHILQDQRHQLLAELQAERAAVRAREADVQSQFANARAVSAELNQERQAHGATASKVREAQLMLDAAKAELERERADHSAMTAERDRFRSSYHAANGELDRLRVTMRDVTEERDRLKSSFDAANEELNRHRDGVRELTAERSRLQSSFDSAEAALKEARGSNSELTAVRQRLQSSFDSANGELDQARNVNRGLTAERDKLQSELETLKAELERETVARRELSLEVQNGRAKTGTMGIRVATSDDQTILPRAKRNWQLARVALESSKNLPPFGARWGRLYETMRTKIPEMATSDEAIHFAQRQTEFDHRTEFSNVGRRFLTLMDEGLSTAFPQFADQLKLFTETPISVADTIGEFRGRLVSNVLFYQIHNVLDCLSVIKPPQIVCEIGGGYGALARLWLANPVAAASGYVIVDAPESLFFAETFLSREFGAGQVHYLLRDEPLDPEVFSRHRIVLCPVSALGQLQQINFDLVLNTGSMQEMPPEWVAYYMDWLDRQSVKYFYSLNYFAQPINELFEGANLCSPFLSSDWACDLLRFNPDFTRLHTPRNYLELLARKDTKAARLSVKEAMAEARHLRGQRMDNDLFLQLFELVRRSRDRNLALDLVRRAMAEMVTRPKEVQFLLETVEQWRGPPLSADAKREIAALHTELATLRAQGQESVVVT